MSESEPGSAQLQIVVADVDAARAELIERGVEVSEVEELPWGTFVFFRDPDGNDWAVQQLPPRWQRGAHLGATRPVPRKRNSTSHPSSYFPPPSPLLSPSSLSPLPPLPPYENP